MAFTITRVAGLSLALTALRGACKAIRKYDANITAAMPPELLSQWNAAKPYIYIGCELLEALAQSKIIPT